MRQFATLYLELDHSNATNDKIEALTRYLAIADPADSAWAIWFLSGNRLKRLLKRANLKRWALEASGHPPWMLDEAYEAVGDLAETIALLLPDGAQQATGAPSPADAPLHEWIEERLVPLGALDETTQGEQLKTWWLLLSADERFVLNKLLTGALRVGVSQRLVTRALAQHLAVDQAVIAHRLMGDWQPAPGLLPYLATGDGDFSDESLPYPFFLATALEAEPETLGAAADWQAEWKWDGIRAQLIKRNSQVIIWSRGEERLDGRFPELEAAAKALPDGTVLDGEIVAFAGLSATKAKQEAAPDTPGRVADYPPYSFAALQRRIGRKKPGPKMLAEIPVEFIAYDLLEWESADWRPRPLSERRAGLEETISHLEAPFRLSPVVQTKSWTALAEQRLTSRDRGVEGLMLKARSSPYGTGRQRGTWWKWKVDPLTVDAVLLYAQPGSGRRSNLLTDYTFGVWQNDELVTVCKAYSGLTNEEITEVDRWIRAHTTERFGPVRAVAPTLVFEIGFEGLWPSKRHKAGVAFRFPRILRWRRDLAIKDADTLSMLQQLVDMPPEALP